MSAEKRILEELWREYPCLRPLRIREMYEMLLESLKGGGKLLICGNGGSASDAEHMVGELMKGFRHKRELCPSEREAFLGLRGGEGLAAKLQGTIRAISLNSQTALLTAVGNDTDYDMVFAQQVYGYGAAGDVLIAMTTSGNSANVVNAAGTARALGMRVIGITGSRTSALEELSDLCLRLPAEETYRVQEYTMPIYHAVCGMLEETLFGSEEALEKQEALK
ncbi:MAG: SIS domain-containing protein [Roseburia sp.]|nr:SIS domain-containing protein [Roseburia sp.]MCM1096447.1 SIS domain-containing protein [Ruminococcus flavefaciens]